MSNLKVWFNGFDYVVAVDPSDAFRACCESHGDVSPEYEGEGWTELPDDKMLTIKEEDAGSDARTCAEWIKINGRGFLCSTEY